MLEWTSKNGIWNVKVTKENWQVFFKGELITEQGRLFASKNVPISVQKAVNDFCEQIERKG